MFVEDYGFSPYFGYTGGSLGDVDNQGVQAKDWVEVKGVEYIVEYYNYPRKKLERLTIFGPEDDEEKKTGIDGLISSLTGPNNLFITRKDKQSYEFSSRGELANWEEANPELKHTNDRMDKIKKIFELFYQKLAEKYDIQGYVDRFEEMAQQQLREAEEVKPKNDEACDKIQEARKKHIESLKGTPDPLEEMFL